MKTLIIYFPDSRGLRTVVKVIAEDLNADVVEIDSIGNNNIFYKIRSLLGFESSIYGVDVNFRDYDSIIIASKVYGGHVSSAIYTLIREYSLQNINFYFLLFYKNSVENAKRKILKEFRILRIRCRALIKIKDNEATLTAFLRRKIKFYFDEEQNMIFRKE